MGGFSGKHMWYYNRNLCMQKPKQETETENQRNVEKGTQSEEKYIWLLRNQERLHEEGDICKRP